MPPASRGTDPWRGPLGHGLRRNALSRAIRALVASTACLAAACLAAACGGAETEKIVVTGSSTVAPLMSEIGRRYEELHPDVRVDVQTGGSSRGVADARKGLADIGMASRAAKPEEADLMWFTIARDGIAMIVNSESPIASLPETGLTSDQVRAIYRGEVQSWSELGGRDALITVVHKVEGRSTLELFLAFFGLGNAECKPDVEVGDNQQAIRTVAGDPDAIGYVSIGTAEFEAQRGTPIVLIPVDGARPSTEAVRDESFPLSRPLNLVTRAAPVGAVEDLIEFARSTAVHDLVEEQFFVPVPR